MKIEQSFIEMAVASIPVIAMKVLAASFFFTESSAQRVVGSDIPTLSEMLLQSQLHRVIRGVRKISNVLRAEELRTGDDPVLRKSCTCQKTAVNTSEIGRRVEVIGKRTHVIVGKK